MLGRLEDGGGAGRSTGAAEGRGGADDYESTGPIPPVSGGGGGGYDDDIPF